MERNCIGFFKLIRTGFIFYQERCVALQSSTEHAALPQFPNFSFAFLGLRCYRGNLMFIIFILKSPEEVRGEK